MVTTSFETAPDLSVSNMSDFAGSIVEESTPVVEALKFDMGFTITATVFFNMQFLFWFIFYLSVR